MVNGVTISILTRVEIRRLEFQLKPVGYYFMVAARLNETDVTTEACLRKSCHGGINADFSAFIQN